MGWGLVGAIEAECIIQNNERYIKFRSDYSMSHLQDGHGAHCARERSRVVIT